MDFWTSLDALRARHDVLRHPFYLRWSAGELTQPELAHYAGQYRHAVVALADAASGTAAGVDARSEPQLRAALDTHAREEADHVGLWDEFCSAVGGSSSATAAPETYACAVAWGGEGGRSMLGSLTAMYAIESSQPAIAATKRAGLLAHYSVPEGPATAYFELHERLDVEHAAAARELISTRLAADGAHASSAAEQEPALLEEAERVLRANWLLLDGVERASSR